ncbi:MAG: AI-2E family transporter [Candidatus Woesearchaeota archaeon]
MVQIKEVPRYFFLLCFLGVMYLSFLLMRPFMTALLTGAIAAYGFYPLYRGLQEKIKSRGLAAVILTLAIITVVVLPLAIVASIVTEQASALYEDVRQKLISGAGENCDVLDIGCRVKAVTEGFFEGTPANNYLDMVGPELTTYVVNRAKDFVIQIPMVLLNIFLVVFVMFYLFIDGPNLVDAIKNLLPMRKKLAQEIMDSFESITSAILRGQLMVALIQGTLGAIGFYIFGVKLALLWGGLMAILAFVPMLGTALVWLPVSLTLILSGLFSGNYTIVWKGVGLIIYSGLIVSTVDNFIGPRIIGRKAKLHPVLVLIGVLGGVRLFGIAGFIIGPLIFGLLIAFARIYRRDHDEISC